MRKVIHALIIVVIAFGLSGCYLVKVKNINNTIFMTNTPKLSVSEMENAVIEAGRKQNWVITKAGNGELDGVLLIRTHVAKVRIVCKTDMSYTIKYVASQNLVYDKELDAIHYNYNKWVTTLGNAIDLEIAATLNKK